MIRRRTLFEQPVIILSIVSYLVVGALLVLPWTAVTSAQDVTSGQQQQQGDVEGGGLQQHPHHHRPLCPDGWVRGSTGGQSFKDKDAGLCLYLSPQALSWSEARRTCRDKDSVLLSLDTVLSVEDKLFPQYLKDKGVGEVWTGMHKYGGRQIWDEPGKDMVKAYRGSRRTLGETKRGWSWDAGTFSDASLTCGLYSYSSDLPHPGPQQPRRRRRGADTPRPGAAPTGSSDLPGREVPAPPAQGGGVKAAPAMAAFKSFLSSQGMESFATKLSDNPADKTRGDTAAPPGKAAADQARNMAGSTRGPSPAPAAMVSNDLPSSLDKTKESPSDKKNEHSSDKNGSGVKDTDSNNNNNNNDSPNDDKNNNNNGTSDHLSSDEDDSTHEVSKRSTPFGHEMTTANPGDFSNDTAAGNATRHSPGATNASNSSLDNTTASAGSSGQDSSPKNDSAASAAAASSSSSFSSSGLFGGGNPGLGKELLDFFNTDSKDTASAGGSPPASEPKTDAPSRDTPVRDSTQPRESPSRPLSPQEFIHQFQKDAGGSAVAGVGQSAAQPVTNTSGSESQAHEELFGGASGSSQMATATPATTTTDPTITTTPTFTTTPDSSFEESTDSSEVSTTTSTPPAEQGKDLGLFLDSASPSSNSSSSSSTSSSSFQQHFGPSSSSPSTNSSAARNDSVEVTPRQDSQEVTPRPDSAEVTPRADSKEVTPRPDSAEVTPRADIKEVTPRPDSAEITPQQYSKEVTPQATDSREATGRQTDSSKEATMSSLFETTQTTTPNTMTTTTTAASFEDNSQERTSLFSDSAPGIQGPTPTTTTSTTTRDRESSEELDHVTRANTGSTTLAQLQGVLQSMTPQPDHVLPSAGHSWMTLQHCQQRQQFVCTAKPVHDFTTMPQCGNGWLGHSLVSRCYRLVSQTASYDQARSQCQTWGGGLASADTAFFANVTHLLLDRLKLLKGFASPVWTKAVSGPQQEGQCSVMEPQVLELQTRDCHLSLPYLCQKPAFRPSDTDSNKKSTDDNNNSNNNDEVNHQELDKPSMIRNMSSWNPQSLLCPVRPLSHHDTVIWFKDGQPVPTDADEATPSSSALLPLSSNSRNPAVLHLNMHLLQRLGVGPRRMQQPALLQGVYWCRRWRQHPLRSVTSDPVYVRFQDVVTLQGFLKTSGITVAEAAFFNEMGDDSCLPAAIGRGLQLMNDRVFPRMQHSQPFLSDIITTVQNANPETDEVEFRTYLCLSTGAMAPQDKGAVVDAYLRVLHTELVASEDLVRRDWNLSTSLEQAFRLLMTEMCPESRLVDKDTGYEATFGSTPVNQHAVSLDTCDGVFAGYAVCHGDLMSGAYWSHWAVDMTCQGDDNDRTHNDSEEKKGEGENTRPKVDPETVADTGKGFVLPHKPNSELLNIDEVHVEQGNVEDVTDRLADILNRSVELTDADVEIVADVIGRVSLVPVLPQDVGLTLLRTVDRVLDSPLKTLQQAQRNSQASTRILQDLDKFSEKLQFGQDDHVRYVTPNVVMEVWNMRAAREPVIGLAAMVGKAADSPLMESRIMTLSNRTWADLHLGELDVAIELPDQLVSGDGVGSGRLSMAIYRKPGLFLSSLPARGGDPGHDNDDVVIPELNSAIISATLASTNVRDLQDRVKLIFRPLKAAAGKLARCVYWDFTLPAGGGWSSRGCVHNGTQQGRDICLCDHLTNFAVLLDFYGDGEPVDQVHTRALSIITIIGLSLSILGLSLTVITFIFFKKLRKGRAHQTLFHMAIALLGSEVVLLAGLKQTAHDGVCLVVAVLLHYFILASFLWMLVEAVLQYLTFVKVLGTYISKYTLKTVLPAWTIPLIPVIAVLVTDYTQYLGRRDYCWMSLDAFYYAFALPVGVIILFNIVTFVVIMLSLLRRPEGLRSTRNKGNTAETNIKAAFTIFVLLGLTWTFGYLAIADARLPFQYMFTVSSSLQGFLIFVLLVARRRQFREQWRTLCCGRRGQPGCQKITPTLSNSVSSQSSTSSFTSSSRSRTSNGGSSKALDILIKRADSNASRSKVQLSSKASPASNRSRQC